MASEGEFGARVDEVTGYGKLGGDDEALPSTVFEHVLTEKQALAALSHHYQQRLGERMIRRFGRHPGQQQPVDRRLHVRSGMGGDQPAELVERIGSARA